MSKTILFFGSGPVAAKSLRLLHSSFTIEAVITKPQPPHHKATFPVIELAQELQLPYFTASSKEDMDNVFKKNKFVSEVGVVIDHGILISRYVIDAFPLGIINSHFSLLPRWRGADPISFSILNGDTETGVSLMIINEKLDKGDLIRQEKIPISPNEDTTSLTEKLIGLSDSILKETLPAYMNRTIIPFAQQTDTVSYSRMLTKEDGAIDWNKSAEVLEREIRAYIEWPRSRTTIFGVDCIITKATIIPENGPPGSIDTTNKRILVYCNQNALNIESLIPAGKKQMDAHSFLNGYGR